MKNPEKVAKLLKAGLELRKESIELMAELAKDPMSVALYQSLNLMKIGIERAARFNGLTVEDLDPGLKIEGFKPETDAKGNKVPFSMHKAETEKYKAQVSAQNQAAELDQSAEEAKERVRNLAASAGDLEKLSEQEQADYEQRKTFDRVVNLKATAEDLTAIQNFDPAAYTQYFVRLSEAGLEPPEGVVAPTEEAPTEEAPTEEAPTEDKAPKPTSKKKSGKK